MHGAGGVNTPDAVASATTTVCVKDTACSALTGASAYYAARISSLETKLLRKFITNALSARFIHTGDRTWHWTIDQAVIERWISQPSSNFGIALIPSDTGNCFVRTRRSTPQPTLSFDISYAGASDPAAPANVAPADGAVYQPRGPALESSPFSGPGLTHAASQWQIAAGPSFVDPVWATTSPTNLLRVDVPDATLDYAQRYYWHARHLSAESGKSDYSPSTVFQTEVRNGRYTLIPDANCMIKYLQPNSTLNGSASDLFWPYDWSGRINTLRDIILTHFDLSPFQGFTVVSDATFSVRWNWVDLNFGAISFTPYLALKPWDETNTTWNTYLGTAGVFFLTAGGSFTNAGGNAANRIAQWRGNTWSTMGNGMSHTVMAIVHRHGGNVVYAGGAFTNAGGSAANRMAVWDGNMWTTLGSGMNSSVFALAVSESHLYAGGAFTTAGGSTVNRIAQRYGGAWDRLGSGMNSSVFAVADRDYYLYAGGIFTQAGWNVVNHIARWYGNSWIGLDAGVNGEVRALAVDYKRNAYAANVYAGGLFTIAGSSAASNIAQWAWTSWTGGVWTCLGSGVNSSVYALAVDTIGNLYAGGAFTTAGGVAANYVAQWNGTAWTNIGSGMNGPVYSLALTEVGDLFAAGSFTTADGIRVNNVAKWNGTTWTNLGTGMDGEVRAIAATHDVATNICELLGQGFGSQQVWGGWGIYSNYYDNPTTWTINKEVLQSWIDNPGTNFGLALLADQDNANAWLWTRRIPARAPQLTFDVVPEPAALALLGIVVMWQRRRLK